VNNSTKGHSLLRRQKENVSKGWSASSHNWGEATGVCRRKGGGEKEKTAQKRIRSPKCPSATKLYLDREEEILVKVKYRGEEVFQG